MMVIRKLGEPLAAVAGKQPPLLQRLEWAANSRNAVEIFNLMQREEVPLNGVEIPPLLVLAAGGDGITMVDFLIKKGCDVNASTADGFTPLMAASRNWNEDNVEKLLKAGAHKNVRDSKGRTALMLAVFEGRLKCARVLLKYGAKVDVVDYEGKTTLHWAKRGQRKEMKWLRRSLQEAQKDCQELEDGDNHAFCDCSESLSEEREMLRTDYGKLFYRLRKKSQKKKR